MKAWVVRQPNEGVFICIKYEPLKTKCGWVMIIAFPITKDDLPEGVNPQWADDDPIEVELNIERASK